MFPLLEINPEIFTCTIQVPGSPLITSRYINTYLWDTNVKTADYTLLIVHSNINNKEFQAFEDTLESLPNYVDSYDILNTAYSVKVFSLNKNYYSEYDNFICGKYSKFSLDAKTLCLSKSPKNHAFTSYLPKIFNKSEDLRLEQEAKIEAKLPQNAEVWSIPDLIKETLNFESQKPLQNGSNKYNRKTSLAKEDILGTNDRD